MNKTALAAAAALATAGSALAFSVAPAQAATNSAQDQAFVTSNAQSNLAEISLGKLGLARATTSEAKELARVTLADHQKLQTELAAAAKTGSYTLPASPNAMQLATAAMLKSTSTSAFDLAFSKAEVTGHVLAIAAANKEKTAGTNTAVTGYATGYVPVATMHYDMATSDVSALSTSSPTAVSAGTGGRAATDTSSGDWAYGAGSGLVLAAGSGVVLYRRRRSA